jgi:hypothetical protein
LNTESASGLPPYLEDEGPNEAVAVEKRLTHRGPGFHRWFRLDRGRVVKRQPEPRHPQLGQQVAKHVCLLSKVARIRQSLVQVVEQILDQQLVRALLNRTSVDHL